MFAGRAASFSSLMMLFFEMGSIILVDGGEQTNYLEIFNQVSVCFTDDLTVEETVSCLSSLTSCFDESSVGTVETCILDSTSAADDGSSEEIADACLGSYKTCIEEEAGDILDSLDPCVQATLYELGICFIDNAGTCSTTCSTDDIPPEGTFSDLTATDVANCDGIQTNIMDPTCQAIDCCVACVGAYENLMNCIVGDVLDMKVLRPPNGFETCAVSCPSSQRRLLLQESHSNRKLVGQQPNANDIVSKCGHLFKSDGVDTTSIPAEILGNRLIQGDPLQCVIGEAIELSMQEQAYNANNDGPSDATKNKPWILNGILVSVLFYALGLN